LSSFVSVRLYLSISAVVIPINPNPQANKGRVVKGIGKVAKPTPTQTNPTINLSLFFRIMNTTPNSSTLFISRWFLIHSCIV